MQKTAKKHLSPEEYLTLEETAESKSEYYQGETFALAGGSLNHNIIIGNVFSHLHQNQDDHKCRITMSDLRLWIQAKELFTYPDIMVICEKPVYYSDRDDTVTNPLIIIEVLSESTENYDRGKKFLFYRSIPTFKEYILIDQYTVHIEQFYISPNGKWQLTEYNDINGILKLSKINVQISLVDVYNQVFTKK